MARETVTLNWVEHKELPAISPQVLGDLNDTSGSTITGRGSAKCGMLQYRTLHDYATGSYCCTSIIATRLPPLPSPELVLATKAPCRVQPTSTSMKAIHASYCTSSIQRQWEPLPYLRSVVIENKRRRCNSNSQESENANPPTIP